VGSLTFGERSLAAVFIDGWWRYAEGVDLESAAGISGHAVRFCNETVVSRPSGNLT